MTHRSALDRTRRISPHFQIREFCRAYPRPVAPTARLLTGLENLRARLGKGAGAEVAITITSGARTVRQQLVIWHARLAATLGHDPSVAELLDGAALESRHLVLPWETEVHAADITARNTRTGEAISPSDVAAAARGIASLGGVGTYPDFTHVDDRDRYADGRPHEWEG